ncbi:hypothetical protein UA75_18770 [Actinoalloteichus sp. GBA129-24]|uniref:Uncharacterized protein n=1 Tax=Actinoalloteichus fjordicus TaxID=1612552 RepID=A0AAC9LF26_9PSEU|nr:hypothetical protein UA74_18280 [Actinoalloteichus fjordicus]APU21744.1 hypothetical protein UA75_18770 [Actinoalloteichus sp. GBA129-24]
MRARPASTCSTRTACFLSEAEAIRAGRTRQAAGDSFPSGTVARCCAGTGSVRFGAEPVPGCTPEGTPKTAGPRQTVGITGHSRAVAPAPRRPVAMIRPAEISNDRGSNDRGSNDRPTVFRLLIESSTRQAGSATPRWIRPILLTAYRSKRTAGIRTAFPPILATSPTVILRRTGWSAESIVFGRGQESAECARCHGEHAALTILRIADADDIGGLPDLDALAAVGAATTGTPPDTGQWMHAAPLPSQGVNSATILAMSCAVSRLDRASPRSSSNMNVKAATSSRSSIT